MLGCCGANLMMTPEHPLQLCGTSLGPERAVPCAVLLCLFAGLSGCQGRQIRWARGPTHYKDFI